jgi:hypothetical protein
MRRYACDITILCRDFTINERLPTSTEIADDTDLLDEPSLTIPPSIRVHVCLKVDSKLAKTPKMILHSVSFADSPPNAVEHLHFLGEESSDYRLPNLDGQWF